MQQRIVRQQVGVQRVAPGRDRHIDHHLLRARNAGVVDQVVYAPKRRERGLHGVPERRWISHIDIGQRMHPALRIRQSGILKLIDDARPHLLKLLPAARHKHHFRACESEQPCDLPADPSRATRDQHGLAEMQPSKVLGQTDHRPASAARVGDGLRQIKVDLRDPLLLEQETCRLPSGERHVLRLIVLVTDDLVGPDDRSPPPEPLLDIGLVAPDADQLLIGGPQQGCINVSAFVVAVGYENHAWIARQVRAFAPVARQRARDGERPAQLVLNEARYVRVACIGKRSLELLRPMGGQHDRTREGHGLVAGPLRRGLQSRLHTCRITSVEVNDVQHPCRG